MAWGEGAGPGPYRPLVERDGELAAVADGVALARSGQGRLLFFQGPAGIGKTAFLAAAAELAGRCGLVVLAGRGRPSGPDTPYALAHELFGSLVPIESDMSDQVVYESVTARAAATPVALVIDDVHRADQESLHLLAYLSRRLSRAAVLVVAGATVGPPASGEGERERDRDRLFAEIEAGSSTTVSLLAALSEAGVGATLEAGLGTRPSPEVVAAWREETGGLPYLVGALVDACRATRIGVPDPEWVRGAAPDGVGATTMDRLGREPGQVRAMAMVISVLGPDATLPRAMALAGLDEEKGMDALDRLRAGGLIERVAGTGALTFVQPIVGRALYQQMALDGRPEAHARVAARLLAEGAEPEAVARHLLHSQPVGSEANVAVLRAAAERALTAGAPVDAVRYLERALGEAPSGLGRSVVELELGRAETFLNRRVAEARFLTARRATTDPEIRAAALVEEARLEMYGADQTRARLLLERARDELQGATGPLRYEIDALWATLGRRGVHGEDGLDPIDGLMDFGWAGGRYLPDGGPADVLALAAVAMASVDRLDRAQAILAQIRASGSAARSVVADLLTRSAEIYVAARRGDLAEAATRMRSGVEASLRAHLPGAAARVLWSSTDVVLEQPDAADVADLVEQIDANPFIDSLGAALLAEASGRIRLAAGDPVRAVEDLSRAFSAHRALGHGASPIRSTLAVALALAGPGGAVDLGGAADLGGPLDLAGAELDDARRSGVATRLGLAERAMGLVHPDRTQRWAHLTESVAAMAGSPSRLEEARSLVALGCEGRAGDDLAAARRYLREGLDLATRCQAVNLARRARGELVSVGARPRRDLTSGLGALTPSELRVAEMAAGGRSNQDIADELYVTKRTVEAHLRHAYAKLGINSRVQLPHALEVAAL